MTKKALWILDIDNYLPELTQVTLAGFEAYARKIGAEVRVIRERMFPDWHVTYEKAQVYHHGLNYDWNLVMDTDLLLHPEFPDLTKRLPENVVGLKDCYAADSRFALNSYFFRDTRKVGVSGVFAMASRHCHDLWAPLPGRQADHLSQIQPLPGEVARGVGPEHFITEYWLSVNLARFGLRYEGILAPEERWMFHHPYGKEIDGKFHSLTDHEKISGVRTQARQWGMRIREEAPPCGDASSVQ